MNDQEGNADHAKTVERDQLANEIDSAVETDLDWKGWYGLARSKAGSKLSEG